MAHITTDFGVFTPEDVNEGSPKRTRANPASLGAVHKRLKCIRHAVCRYGRLAVRSSLDGFTEF